MKRRIYADDSLIESLGCIIEAKGIQIDLTKENDSDVRVFISGTRKESDLKTLYSGGWIACRTALSMAKKLEIPRVQMGLILNHLDIKVKNCSLGCF